jgi:hypothetical protein
VKTRGARLTTSGLGRANTNFRRLLRARPLSTAISISHATPGLRSRNRYPATAKTMIRSTATLPRLVTSRAASCNHGGPMGIGSLSDLRRAKMTRRSKPKDLRVATSKATNPNRKRRAAIVKREARAIAPYARPMLGSGPRRNPSAKALRPQSQIVVPMGTGRNTRSGERFGQSCASSPKLAPILRRRPPSGITTHALLLLGGISFTPEFCRRRPLSGRCATARRSIH